MQPTGTESAPGRLESERRRAPMPRETAAMVLVSFAALLWAYVPTIVDMAERWSIDPQYSHAFLVPMFAAGWLWVRRDKLRSWRGGSPLVGLLILVAGTLIHLAGAIYYLSWLPGVSMLVCLIGIAMYFGGNRFVQWCGPAIAFCLFMVPLPFRVQHSMGAPLQRITANSSTWVLQTLGFPAVNEGNIVIIDAIRIGVVEACSGLGMLVTFAALSAAVAMSIDRPWTDRVLILLSAAPVAIVANIVRVTVTAILAVTAGPKLADLVFHDLAGWLMMPLALGILILELKFVDHLLPEDTGTVPLLARRSKRAR